MSVVRFHSSPQKTASMSKVTKPTRYQSVLLVDDNDIDNFINERIILSFDFSSTVIVRTSGLSALQYLREFLQKPEKLPQIIFLDLNMPIMDGFQFLEEFDLIVQNYPVVKEKCRVIVLSSSMSPDDINRASINPYVHKYINKPLTESYLEAINL